MGRKCRFLQGVISCDSRFGKAVQVTVSPVSCPVLYFGLEREEIAVVHCE